MKAWLIVFSFVALAGLAGLGMTRKYGIVGLGGVLGLVLIAFCLMGLMA
jgi:hypothetical protein